VDAKWLILYKYDYASHILFHLGRVFILQITHKLFGSCLETLYGLLSSEYEFQVKLEQFLIQRFKLKQNLYSLTSCITYKQTLSKHTLI